MDELQISGKRFISARRIARENGYTSDYIGQLIRGGKLVGQKVGRAWYVDASSFDRYLGSEVASVPVTEPEPVVDVQPEAELTSQPLTDAIEEKVEPLSETAVEAETAPSKNTEPDEELGASEFFEEPKEPAALHEEDVVEEEIIEKTPEPELAVEVVAAEADIAEVIPQRIPLRINRKVESTTPAPAVSGLRYYADDMPALPEIVKQTKESRVMNAKEEIQSIVEKEISSHARRSRKPMVFGSIVAAGLAVFIFVAVVSSAVSLNLSIQEGNAAAASYGLGW